MNYHITGSKCSPLAGTDACSYLW